MFFSRLISLLHRIQSKIGQDQHREQQGSPRSLPNVLDPNSSSRLDPNQLSAYALKWEKIALRTDPVDFEKATAAVRSLYQALHLSLPEIRICASPEAALKEEWIQLKIPADAWVLGSLRHDLTTWTPYAERGIDAEQGQELWNSLGVPLEDKLASGVALLKSHFQTYFTPFIPEEWAPLAAWLEVCLSDKGLSLPISKALAGSLQAVIQECGWIYPLEGVGILVCDRPRLRQVNQAGRLHAIGEPAVLFADGSKVYAYDGVRLPEEYHTHPRNWKAEWILTENNAEVRRALIQGIGYERLCQDLNVECVDQWQGYTLLRIPLQASSSEIPEYWDWEEDPETEICLLKMVCPSTGSTHLLRVPPYFRSAREAIVWINWGIDPESFIQQT
jgi:hypothetical protein